MADSKYEGPKPEQETQVKGHQKTIHVKKDQHKFQKRGGDTKSMIKYGVSLFLGLIAAYFVISIIRIEVRGRSLIRTNEEWRELLKEHPYEHKETDVRSPCPMLNTLANHGFINRSGRDIKSDDLFDALMLMGAPPTVTVGILKFVYTKLKEADPDSPFLSQFGEMKTLDLDRLTIAGVLEHDVSLTRNDLSMPPHTTSFPIADYVVRMHNLAAFSNKGSEYDGIFTRKNENDARRLRWLESYKYNKHMHLNLFSQVMYIYMVFVYLYFLLIVLNTLVIYIYIYMYIVCI